jgi:hypothetical protein
MLLADICAKLRLLRPVAARLSLFSLLVVEEDAWETFAAEKAALTVALLGHSEAACLDGIFGTGLDEFRTGEVMQHSVSGYANNVFNAPIDYVQQEVGYDVSPGLANTFAVGITAAAVEYGTGRLGDVASNGRNKYETGESQEDALRKMGISRS